MTHPSLPADAIETFQQRGIVVYPGLVPPADIDLLFDATRRSYRAFAGASALPVGDGFDDPAFSAALIALRAQAPVRFGALYDTMQTSLALMQVSSAPALARVAAELLGDTQSGLSATGHMLRMDPPSDRRNALDWHQEAAYYRQHRNPSHGIVLWMPLHDVRLAHGPVIVCPGSHHRGLIEVERAGKAAYEQSEQIRIPADELARYTPESVEARAGDVVFFHMNLFHRSGVNTSTHVRFVAGVRFLRMHTRGFVPGRLLYHPNTNFDPDRDGPDDGHSQGAAP